MVKEFKECKTHMDKQAFREKYAKQKLGEILVEKKNKERKK